MVDGEGFLMAVTIHAIGSDGLAGYGQVPMVCDVRSILAVEEVDGGLGGLTLHERPAEAPYLKNYEDFPESSPVHWHTRFDLANWGFWVAREEGRVVGGAAVAWNTAGVNMLEGRRDLAVLWDLRVCETHRRHGVGSALFKAAAAWAKAKECRQMKIESQNVNIPACRFYARMGCRLGQIDRMAYRGQPVVAHEVMLVWYLDLAKESKG